ncbi:arf-GAP with coiled-coil, ANK repeat and PH domain-containing protein 3-like, partial [Narcine bancroftii]|uniref:arf-GAP with coiled-coil, ANK repeat and PH domain-containing protein 3-like n=1 Tax=Narcine bancroftii TaxID=1343680 RepID=UPI003831ABD6
SAAILRRLLPSAEQVHRLASPPESPMAAQASIEGVELEVTELEVKLEKLLKLCSAMLEAGRTYSANSRHFVNGIRDLAVHCKGDEMMTGCLEKFSCCLTDLIEYQTTLIDVTQKSVRQHLYNFIKE